MVGYVREKAEGRARFAKRRNPGKKFTCRTDKCTCYRLNLIGRVLKVLMNKLESRCM